MAAAACRRFSKNRRKQENRRGTQGTTSRSLHLPASQERFMSIIEIDQDKCIGCGTCRADCPTANIAI
ncbi:MAG TPA: 4Fe-4S binding protein, partial [Smithella sp.]|nr:4Fe-4S binding protein [Smithella sp.]